MGCCSSIAKRPSLEQTKDQAAKTEPRPEQAAAPDVPHSRHSSKARDDSKQTSADPKYVSIDIVPSRQEPEILPRVIEILPGPPSKSGFILEPGYLLTTADAIETLEQCRSLLPSLQFRPDLGFFVCKELNFTIIALDPTHRPVGFAVYKSTPITKSELEIAGSSVTLDYIGESQLFYNSTAVNPGSPILFHRKVVGMHDSRHRGVSILGICRQLSTPPHWSAFIESCKAEIPGRIPGDKIWNIAGERLLSFDMTTHKFETYSTKVPSGAQLCLYREEVIITGGTVALTPVAIARKFKIEGYGYEELKAMANSHSQHACALSLPHQLFIISGLSEGGITNECERYNIKKNQWLPIYPITRGRIDSGATEFQEAIYVYGGTGKAGRPILEMEMFKNTSWSDILFQSSAPHLKARLASDSKTILILGQQAVFWDLKRVRTLGKQAAELPGDVVYWRENTVYVFSGTKVMEGRMTSTTLTWSQHGTEAVQRYIAYEI